eukprot:scaffold117045_cov32-Tisochrysis_lutea.AAC.2
MRSSSGQHTRMVRGQRNGARAPVRRPTATPPIGTMRGILPRSGDPPMSRLPHAATFACATMPLSPK